MTIAPGMLPTPEPVTSVVALEPVYNILMSMAALFAPEEYGGVDEWVTQTVNQLDPALRARHQFLMKWFMLDLLANAVDRGPATATFPAYLDALAVQDPVVLRDCLLHWFIHSVHIRVYYDTQRHALPDPAALLSDITYFTEFVTHRFARKATAADLVDLPDFHALLNQPVALQETLVTHLQTMWQTVIAEEWARIRPRLQACVDAFQQVPLTGCTLLEAMQIVTGRDMRPAFRIEELWAFRQVRFIPNIHNGPYIIWFGDEEELRIGFPSHEPPTSAYVGLRFDQSTLVNRYKALADETRLGILWALREAGQLSTQAIIDRFDLDKSAASRHLRQLVATSLIDEQREEGAKKVYALNPRAVDEVIRMLNGLR